ncbi:MAG: cytidine deaminase [Thermoplasmataceae archaeon]|jgi:cytidine deaminase
MSKNFELDRDAYGLIHEATEIIKKHYRKHWHSVGCALLTSDGSIYTSFNIDATVGRIAVCAEPIAIAQALKDGKNRFDTIVAVRHPDPEKGHDKYEVIPPCGMCREISTDYDMDIGVLIETDGKTLKMKMRDLLPYKYTR